MADPQSDAAVPQPGPGAAQDPARVPAPAPAPPPGPSPLTAGEEAEFQELAARRLAAADAALADVVTRRQQAMAAAAGTLAGGQFRVEPPHSSFTYGGITITTEYMPVPPAALPALIQAASEAGVTLTQAEEG